MVMAETKAGYKKTDIGVIPEDWGLLSIGSCIGSMRGGAPLKPSDFQKSGVKVLPKGAVCKGGVIKLKESDTQFCSLSYFSKHVSNQVDSRFTIVVLRDLVPSGPTIGTVVRNQYEEPFLLAQGVYGFLVNNQLLHDRYLIQLSNSDEYRRMMQSIMVGSTQVHITNGAFKKVLIPLPKPEEQKQIAAALSDVDGLIESLEQLIAKKRDMKTAAMQQLLTGKKRLPGFGTSHDIQETIFGGAPKDWIITTLQSICTFENGDRGFNYPSKSDFQVAGIPFVNAGHLKNKKVQLDGMDFITQEKFDQLGGGKFKVGDILFCLRGSLGKYAVIKHPDLFGAIASSLIIIRPKKGCLNSDFFEFYLESEHCERMIDLFAGGAAQPNLGGQDLSKFFILLPPTPEEQKAIAAILSDMDSEIDALEQRLEKARSLKTGMMQELLTGKTRLINADNHKEVAA